MPETTNAISGESGAGDAEFPKGDEGTNTPDNGQVIDPAKPQEESVIPGTQDDPSQTIREEIVKRFGEGKSDQEYLNAAWESYRNGEKIFGQTENKVKELEGLVNQFGGVDALKQALITPATPTTPENKLPDRIQKLVDDGYLDPKDPKDALIIDQEIRLEQSNQAIGRSTQEKAIQSFDSGLKSIAAKYEHADVDAIRELGLKGAFMNMTDSQMWAAIDQMASKQHSKIVGLVDTKTQEKLDALKKLNEKKNLESQPGGGKPTKQTAQQAFESSYSQHFKE